jgi:RNA polymerase sigma-70 factor (ECF subfamily)
VRHTYEPGRPVKPWLVAIVTRRAIDAGRKRGRIGAHEIFNEVAYETFSDPRANEGDSEHNVRTLTGMTQGLSPDQREALDLVKMKEMSLAEASALSGQSVAALKVNIHRAIKKMRAHLLPDPD